MKYLTNKKLWAAIIGLITALGTLMVTLDEAKAAPGALSPNIQYHFDSATSSVSGFKPTDLALAQVHFVMDNNINGQVDANKCVYTSTIQPYN